MNSPHLFTPTAQAHYSKLPKPPTATSAVNTHVPNFSSTANNNFNKNSSIGTNSNNLSNNFINNNNISNNSNSLIASLSSATAQATTATASPLMPAAAENLTTLSNSPATNTVPSFSSPQTSISNKIAPARRLAARQTLRLTIPKQHGDTFILPSTNSNTAPISSSNHNNHHIIFKHTSPSQLPPAPILKRTATGSVLTSQHQQNIPKSASPLESHNLPNVTPSAFTHSHTPSTLSCSSSSAVSNNGSSKYLGSLRKPSITLNSSDIRNNNDLLAFAKSLTPPSVDLNDHHSPIFSEISSSMSPSSSTASPTNHLSRLFNLSPPTFRNYGNMSDFSDSSQNGVITPATSLIENFHKKNGSPSTNTSLVGSTSPSLNGTNAIANNGVNCLSNCNSLTGRQINTSSSSCSSVKETSSTSQQVVNSSSTTTRVEKTSQRLHHITSSSSSTSSSSQATSSSEMKTAALKRDLNEIKSSMSEINDLALGRNTTNASNSSETVINELKKKIKSSFENLVDGDDNQYVTFPDDDDHDHNLGSCLDLVDTSKSVQIPENGKIIDAVKFEEKRTKTESKTKVVADGFSSEQATSNSAEVKRLQAGDIDYKEAKAAAAMRNRMEVGGVKTEENAALIQEAISLKTGDITQQASNNVAAASKKYQSDNFSADQKSISQSQQSQTVTSNGIISQEKHVSSASQSNYTMTHKGVSSTGSSMISSSSQMSTTNSQLIKLADLKLDDLKALCAGSGTKEIEQTIVKYSKVLESVVESLQESKAPNPEKSLYLDKINEVIEKAWSVPTHGHQLGYSLCSSLRKSGGLDLLMRNCVQGDMQIKFSSAKLLEQCLTTENREHVVHNGLDKVVNVACVCTRNTNTEQSRVGTGILEHLFKHSEGTCSDVIKLGGLDAVLFECRTSDVETLRHCASALANLSLYGGAENQEAMINRKVPMWLFPLAFHDDDNIKYYACLAIAVLVANKEIEAEVLKSGCLDLVEPFVTTHDPSEFAKSNLAHAHGQSEAWLRRLVPVLSSNREEARNLAAFHFCMEAGIKKQQNETKIFQQIGAIEALKTVASCPNAIASKFAAQALRLIDEEVPHKLSQQVPLWSVEDVKEWVKQIGFSQYSKTFEESKVDGDLLLKLTDENLRNDIGLTNGILLKRFERELQILKRMADYSSKDSAKIHQFLAEIGPDYCTYTYSMLNAGIDKLSLPQLNEDMLLGECGIKNSIHRLRILNAVKNLENSLPSSSEENMAKTLDVFVSYRRSNGSQLASLLKVHLQLRGFSVFIDVERLEAGKFDNGLLNSIRQAKNFVLVLTPRALERCVGDEEGKDWVHREIVAALDSNCNIIPIIDQQFAWPEFEKLPEDMRSVCHFNGVTWSHDYQDACIEKIERFMRGDRVDRPIGPTTTYQRMQSNDSDYTTNNGNVVGSSSVGVTPNGGGQGGTQNSTTNTGRSSVD